MVLESCDAIGCSSLTNNSMEVFSISITFFLSNPSLLFVSKTLPPYLEVVGVLSVFVVLIGQFLECHYGFVYM